MLQRIANRFAQLAVGMLVMWALAALLLAPVDWLLRLALALTAGTILLWAQQRLAPRSTLLIIALLASAVGLSLRAWPEPSNERRWSPGQDRLAHIEIREDQAIIHNLRNFRYAASGAPELRQWETRSYDLAGLDRAWLGVSPFGGVPGIGHVFVSFGFRDGQYLALSIEARREQHESYGPIRGLFRNYETIYILGDERDIIGLRSNIWRDDVYLYPVRASGAAVRAVLLDIFAQINVLHSSPEFYNTLLRSCSSNLAAHVNRVAPGTIPLSLKLILAAYSDELAAGLGLLDIDGELAPSRTRYRINDRALNALQSPDFSRRIRGIIDTAE